MFHAKGPPSEESGPRKRSAALDALLISNRRLKLLKAAP